MSTTIGGVRIVDMPDLGAINDTSSLVGERAGSGRFGAAALSSYVATSSGSPLGTLSSITALRANTLSKGAGNPFYVTGYAALSDGGEGLFVRATADTTSADNSGTIIVDSIGQRWYRQSGAGNALSVRWFGAKGDSVTDDLAAFNKALAAASVVSSNSSAVVHVPRGTYLLSAPISYTFGAASSTLAISGDGAEESLLLWPTGTNGMTINYLNRYNSIHIAGLTFLGGGTNAGTALTLTGAFSAGNPGLTEQNDIVRCTFRGSDGPAATKTWANGVVVTQVSAVNLTGCAFVGSSSLQGTGFSCSGTSTQYPATINLDQCYFYNLATGVLYGNNTQGVILSQCTILNTTGGVVVPASLTNLDELQIIGCDISCVSACVSMATAVPTFMVTGSFIQVPVNAAGLLLSQHNLFSITGNVFSGEPGGGSGQNAIEATQTVGSVGGVIVGNSFSGLVGYAVLLGASTTNITVADNIYNSVGTQIGNAGTNNNISGGYESHADAPDVNMVIGSGKTAAHNAGITLRDRATDQWHIFKGTDNNLRIANFVAGADAIEIDVTTNLVNCPQGIMTSFGATWLGGTAAPAHIAPIGSLFSRIGGTVGATLYVSRGGGTWAAVAGV